MLENEHECPNININAQNLALMIKNEHLCPTFEQFFHTCQVRFFAFFLTSTKLHIETFCYRHDNGIARYHTEERLQRIGLLD